MQLLSPSAQFVSVDIAMTPLRQLALKQAKQPEQRLTYIVGNSQTAEAVERVKQAVGSHELDLLFIDGDHAYEGVKRDFELYSPLVRRGGIVAFHDIVPDYRTALGVSTPSITEGVPRFWKEIKGNFNSMELIDDPEQDGYGIGIIRW